MTYENKFRNGYEKEMEARRRVRDLKNAHAIKDAYYEMIREGSMSEYGCCGIDEVQTFVNKMWIEYGESVMSAAILGVIEQLKFDRDYCGNLIVETAAKLVTPNVRNSSRVGLELYHKKLIDEYVDIAYDLACLLKVCGIEGGK